MQSLCIVDVVIYMRMYWISGPGIRFLLSHCLSCGQPLAAKMTLFESDTIYFLLLVCTWTPSVVHSWVSIFVHSWVSIFSFGLRRHLLRDHVRYPGLEALLAALGRAADHGNQLL